MRSKPSATDEELLAELARRNVPCSATKLESWRRDGLAFRPKHVHLGRHGSTAVFEVELDTVADQVAAVAARRRRGVPAAVAAVQITADGWPVADDDLVEQGYQRLLGEILGMFEVLVDAARQPDDEDDLEVAERISTSLLATKTKLTRVWAANLAAAPAPLAEPVTSVLASAGTAMAQLLLGDDPHEDAVAEMVVAMGLGHLVDDLAREHGLTLIRQGFARRPVLDRLRVAAEADADSIRAAGEIMSALWLLVEHWNLLPPQLATLKPSGDAPEAFVFNVAICLVFGAGGCYDVAGLVEAGSEAGVLDRARAARVTAAAERLRSATPME